MLLSIIILVSLRSYPTSQILILYILTSLKSMYHIRYFPFEEPRDNYISLINEQLVMVTLLVYMCLSQDEVSNLGVRNILGLILLGAVVTSVAINLGNIFVRLYFETLRPVACKIFAKWKQRNKESLKVKK
jgi:hypothetical protein